MVLLEPLDGLAVKSLLHFFVIPNVGRSFVPTLMLNGVSSCNSPKCLSSNISIALGKLFGVLVGDPKEAFSGGCFTSAAGSEVRLQDDWKMEVCKANSNNSPERSNQKLAAGSFE